MNPFSLVGKTILITGASSGIGRATAISCSQMGAVVILTGRNETRLSATYSMLEGQDHQQICADLTIQNEMDKLIELKSIRIAHWTFIFGFIIAMCSLALGSTPYIMLIILFCSGLISSITSEVTKLYFYRKGI